MKKLVLILVLLAISLSCKKDKEEWPWCTTCSIDDIEGHYEGLATYVHVDADEAEHNLSAYLQISKRSDNGIRVLTGLVDRFAVNLTGTYDNTYYISLGTNSQTFTGNILERNGQIRIQASVKKLLYDNKTNTWEVNEYIDIDMYKVSEEEGF
jgi:hypothetical protein